MDEPELKIIDVFICKLRKKLSEATGRENHIETVWGRGYVLRDPKAGRLRRRIWRFRPKMVKSCLGPCHSVPWVNFLGRAHLAAGQDENCGSCPCHRETPETT